MSWAAVQAAINFTYTAGSPSIFVGALSPTDQTFVLSYLNQLYHGSGTAQALLERGIEGGREISLYRTAVDAPGLAVRSQNIAGFNLTAIDQRYQINDKGVLVAVNPLSVIIHELFHAIDGTRDLLGSGALGQVTVADLNSSSFDYKGETVVAENVIASEMGRLNDIRPSFGAVIGTGNPDDTRHTKLRSDISYSDGNEIDIVRYGSNNPSIQELLDLSNRIDGSRDIVIGFDGIDYIYTGAAADYLYGGVGDDVLSGGSGNDLIHGGDRSTAIAADGFDTVDYRRSERGVSPHGVVLSIGVSDDLPRIDGFKPIVVDDDGFGGTDRLVSIERIILPSGVANRVVDTKDYSGYGLTGGKLEIIGGGASISEPGVQFADIFDYSSAVSAVFVGSTDTAFAAEFSSYDPQTQTVQYIWNVFVPLDDPSGGGLNKPTGLQYSNFEHVIGSSYNDALLLWWLNPGGELSAGQEAAFAAARTMTVTSGGTPADIGAALDGAMEAARQIEQNQAEIIIEGGAGNDFILGTRTGHNKIYGEEGVDHLYAGGFTSEIFGGDGIDLVEGGGFKSHLYGGNEGGGDDSPDLFGLANRAFVMDANEDDFAVWGPFRVTGGVEQWWMEGGYAYWSPFTSLISGSPMGFLDTFGAIAMMLDAPAMMTFRFALAGDQLVVQFARGRGGQAVIEDYQLDLDTGEATAHIVAFQQVMVAPGSATLADFETYVRLALKAGFGTDPLILDLDGDGFEFVRRGNDDIYFDLDGDDFAERTAWVKGDDGFLARDLNSNGAIDDITELFGNATTSGFTALAALDSNSDGKIDASDVGFGTLRIWRDLDQDGVTDAGELQTLVQAGITEISLTTSAPTTGSIKGNTLTAEATFKRADGSTSKIADVTLDSNQTDSRYQGDTTVSSEAAELPNLKGYGNVTALAVAMTDDSTLADLVEDFSELPATTTWADLEADTQAILFRWAGVDGVTATAMGGGTFDRQKLAFLEKYFGYEMTPRDSGGVPAELNLAELIASWNDVLAKTTVRLTAQGPQEALFGSLPYDVVTDRFFATSSTTLAEAYEAALAQLSSTASVALADWNSNWGPMLAAYAEALVRHDKQEIRTDFAVQNLLVALDGTTVALTLQELVTGLGLESVHVGTDTADTMARGSATGLQVFVGGEGNDTMTGGAGQDVYVFGRDFGQDTIIDSGEVHESGDRIRLALYNADDVTIRRDGDDLIIEIDGTTDRITVKDHYSVPTVSLGGIPTSANHRIEEIQFADGTIYEAGEIAAAVGLGTSGIDTINGSALADEIEGLAGDDLLRGGDSGDLYYYSRGDGHDTIQDVVTNPLLKGFDTLLLLGMTVADLRLSRDGASNDLVIEFAWTGDSITIEDQFDYTALGFQTSFAPDSRIEAIFFQQGAGWSWIEVQANLVGRYTTSGNDTTYGFGTADQFSASAGNDTLIGFDGGDIYGFGLGSGQDIIDEQARYPQTLIDGMVRYDWGPDDAVVFGEGIDLADVTFTRTGAAPDLLITIDGSSDTLLIKDQFDGRKLDIFNILGVKWLDKIEEFRFADNTVLTWEDILAIVTTGGAGDDALYGDYYTDTLDGKAGNDFLSGADEGDTYLFGVGYGHDTIEDNQKDITTPTADKVSFGAGILPGSVSFSRNGASNDVLITLATGETLLVKNQFAASATGPFGTVWFDRIESFEFTETGAVLTADDVMQLLITQHTTTGDDDIYGFWREDILDGGAGNDFLSGGAEGDTYIWGRGYDDDEIEDLAYPFSEGTDVDRIEFTSDIAPEDIQLSRPLGTDDLVFTIGDTGETLTVRNQFSQHTVGLNYFAIEEFRFADETVWTLSDIRPMLLAALKTSGDDTIIGYYTADRLDGGAGNDRLEGAGGGDTYVFGRGYGQDVVNANIIYITRDQPDHVEFAADVAPADIQIAREGDDLILTISGTDDSLRIEKHFSGLTYWRVEEFRFADETVWTWEDIQSQLLIGTSGDDVITGFYGSNDYLDGGAGNDILMGGGGNDTYAFGLGYGRDIIEDDPINLNGNAPDRLIFGEGIELSDLEFVRVDQFDLVIRVLGTEDEILIRDQYTTYLEISTFVLEDGTILTTADVNDILAANAPGLVTHRGTLGNDALIGTDYNDVFDGRAGDDTLAGGWGSDTYRFAAGYGDDTIAENGLSQDVDVVKLIGLNPADVTVGRFGNDLFVSINATGEMLKVTSHFSSLGAGIEQLIFADTTTWDRTTIQANAAFFGTSGADTINGTTGSETIDGLGGNDLLKGGWGSDTYLYRAGSGSDIIEDAGLGGDVDKVRLLDLLPTDVSFTRVGNDLFIAIAPTGEVLTFKNQFSGAIEQLIFSDGTTWTAAQMQAAAVFIGTSGADTLNGTSADETLSGLAGNDTIWAGSGHDTLLGGADNDTLYGQDGNDSLIGDSGNDTLDGGTGNDSLVGGSGNDTFEGGTGNDTFNGGIGDDTIVSGAGSDSYYYASGDGNDFLDDASALTTETDTLWFTDVNAGGITLTRSGLQMIVTITATGHQITLDDQFRSDTQYWGIEEFKFADGTTWNRNQIFQNAWWYGTSGNDTMAGWGSYDRIDGGAGNDTISGGSGDDILIGGSGDDTLNDTTGNDVFTGGLGNDTFRSGAGSDSYFYASADGSDLLDDQSASLTDVDILTLSDLNPADVMLTKVGAHVYIDIIATGYRITLEDQLWSATDKWGIEEVHFANQTVWDRAYLAANAAIRGTSGNDTLTGTAGADLIVAGLGNDTINSAGGADTIIYASGDGNDYINDDSGSTSNVDVLKFTDLNASDITLTKSGLHVVVTVTATGHQITLDEQYKNTTENWGIDQFTFANGTTWNRDQIMQNAWWNGTTGNDTMSGWALSDQINGGAGNDTINGNAGIDTIIGGSGNDTLTGGTGNDKFVFQTGFGVDTINDFTVGSGSDDVIEFQNGIFANFAAVQSASQQVGSDVQITVDASNSILLKNVTLGNLHQDDFLLV